MIRLIGIDVDGTLLDSSGRLPDENVEAIHEAVSAGIEVALVTGRSYPWARPIADALPDTITLIVSNGAVQRTRDGATLDRHLLPAPVAREVLDLTREFRGSAALIFDRDTSGQIVYESMDWAHPARAAYYQRNQAFIASAATLEAALVEDPVQVMFNGGVVSMRSVAALLAGSAAYAVSLTEYEHRDFSLLDITSPTATKGQALMRRAQALNLSRDQVMAVGDNFNDVEMLESVGVPVVMGNAVDALKRRGWHETAIQDECGVARAIRRYALR